MKRLGEDFCPFLVHENHHCPPAVDHTPFSESHWSIEFDQGLSYRAWEVLELEIFGQFIYLSFLTTLFDDVGIWKIMLQYLKFSVEVPRRHAALGQHFYCWFFGGK